MARNHRDGTKMAWHFSAGLWSLYIFTRRVRAEARTHMVERVSTKHVGPGFSPDVARDACGTAEAFRVAPPEAAVYQNAN